MTKSWSYTACTVRWWLVGDNLEVVVFVVICAVLNPTNADFIRQLFASETFSTLVRHLVDYIVFCFLRAMEEISRIL